MRHEEFLDDVAWKEHVLRGTLRASFDTRLSICPACGEDLEPNSDCCSNVANDPSFQPGDLVTFRSKYSTAATGCLLPQQYGVIVSCFTGMTGHTLYRCTRTWKNGVQAPIQVHGSDTLVLLQSA